MKDKRMGKPFTKKKIIVFVCVALIIITGAIYASQNIAIGFNPIEDMRSLVVVTDKKLMNSVDKIVIETPKKYTIITDKSFIRRFCNKTDVPISYPAKVAFGKIKAYLYHGEELVRTMQIGEDGNYYFIIVIDENTPVYYLGRKIDTGMQELVTLSRSLADEMNEFLEADGNSFE